MNKLIIFIFCILKLILHLIADFNSGFQGDELLHIETGNHLAFGYMEFPPLIGIVAFIQNLFNSNSIIVHHLFTHLAGIVILIFVAKTTLEIGGKEKAVFLVLLGFIIAPSFGRSQQLFQPVVFSQLFWVLGFYQLVKFIKQLNTKNLWYLAIFITLGFSTKYDSVFFVFGLSGLFFFKRTRESLLQHKFWHIALLSLLIVLPNLVWQYLHDFPAFQMFGRLYETQLNKISRLENLGQLLLASNPLNLSLLVPAIMYFFSQKGKEVRLPLAITMLLSFLFLLYSNGKAYYFFSIILTILPFGAVYLEQNILEKKTWLIYPITILLLLGSLLVPFGLPIYPFKKYLSRIQKYENTKVNGGSQVVRYDEYYAKEKWQNTMKEIKSVYDSLPQNERKNCIIWGKHYAQAGAVNLLGSEYNLPKAFCYHGSFYNWTPNGEMPNTLIALSYQVGDFFNPYFAKITLVKSIYNPYADNEEELYQRIYICKEPKQNFGKMKELFEHRIFE